MKKINIKISRDFLLVLGLGIFLLSGNLVHADLDKKFRENFSEIVKNQYHSSIDYTVDDQTGFEIVEENGEKVWRCTGQKCADYHKKINCLFDDAFDKAVNITNLEIKDFTKQNFAELRKVQIKDSSCERISLENIQDEQELNGFKSSCAGKFKSKPYSACRVSETILNELGAYQNFLLAKIEDAISFSRENFEHDEYKNEVLSSLSDTKEQYRQEIEKSQQATVDSLILYKDFIFSTNMS